MTPRTKAERLRIALPKCAEIGAIANHLRLAGLAVDDVSAPGLHYIPDPLGTGFGFELFTLDPGDVGTYVEHGICHLGVMSTDLIREAEVELWRPFTFSFGSYPLVMAALKGQSLENLTARPVLRLATPLPGFTREWFASRGITIDVVTVRDSAETAVLLGLADAWVDRLAHPERLVDQGFRVVEVLGHTYLKLIVNNACGSRRRGAINRFIEKLRDTQPPAPAPIAIPFDGEI